MKILAKTYTFKWKDNKELQINIIFDKDKFN